MPTAQVRFADSDRPDEQQPGLVGGILFDKAAGEKRAWPMLLLLLVVRVVLEVAEFAVFIARRDVRRRQQAVAAVSDAAFAAHHFALLAALDGLPSGAATDRTGLGRGGHELNCNAESPADAMELRGRFAPIQNQEESVGDCGNPGVNARRGKRGFRPALSRSYIYLSRLRRQLRFRA